MFTKRHFLIILLLLSVIALSAQPMPTKGLTPLSSVDVIHLPRVNNLDQVARVRSAIKEEYRGPKKFALPIKTTISTDHKGTWESIEDDQEVWRVRIHSQDAYSLNFAFSEFYLPPSAHMYLYTSERKHIIGPLTMGDNDNHRQWWSPIIPSDEVVIEIQIHTDEKDQLKAIIGQVNHDFSGFGALLSGSCNVDINCGAAEGYPLIDAFRDVMKSVGMYSINGVDLCTGALINTTRNDCTPYMLTALHCEVTPENAASVVVYWNYENSTCRTPNSPSSGRRGDGQRNQFNSGTRYIAGYAPTDFNLLLLDDPVSADYQPYFSGWDRETEIHSSAVTIHHPNSEEKRFSADLDTLTAYADNVFFRVGGWEIGTTEGGSSGAPLYDLNGKIIGQLNGGLAACGNNDFDDFGMLKISWEGGGTPETRLKDWLDPDNTGATAMGGRSCTDVIQLKAETIEFCAIGGEPFSSIEIEVKSGYPEGADITLSGLPDQLSATLSTPRVAPGQPATLTIGAKNISEPYVGNLQLTFSDSFTEQVNTIPLRVDVSTPDAPGLIQPLDGTEGIDFEIDFEWENNGQVFELQISESPIFQDTLFRFENIEKSQMSVPGLSAETTYYWRVKSSNTCGSSPFSATATFTTGTVICRQYKPQDLPKVIPDQPSIISSVVNVTDPQSIAKVKVLDTRGKHTWISDLEFRLIGPDNTTIDLLLNGCNDEDDFDVSFDQSSDLINLICPINDGKTYRPRGDLSTFKDMNAAGAWTLEVKDGVNQDGGSLDHWILELCLIQNQESRSASIDKSSVTICTNTFEPILIKVQLSGDWSNTTQVELINLDSSKVIATALLDSVSGGEILFDDFQSFTSGSKLMTVRISDGDFNIDRQISIDFVEEDLSTTPKTPSKGETGVELSPTLSWQSTNGKMYQLQLLDSTFTMILDTVLTSSELVVPKKLTQLSQYYWRVITSGDCSPPDTTELYHFVTKRSTSTSDTAIEGLSIYPNPTSTFLTIDFDQSWDREANIIIYDLAGKRIKSWPLRSYSEQLDLRDLPAGIMIYQIVNGKDQQSGKIIIVR